MLCTKCNQEKDINEFYKQKDRKKGVYSHCKVCKDKVSNDKWKQRREWAINYKGGKCLDCNQVYPPYVYDFHHLDPASKDIDWSKMRIVKLETMIAELDKCVLLCSNCHRHRHYSVERT
jgi:hypothetical protein